MLHTDQSRLAFRRGWWDLAALVVVLSLSLLPPAAAQRNGQRSGAGFTHGMSAFSRPGPSVQFSPGRIYGPPSPFSPGRSFGPSSFVRGPAPGRGPNFSFVSRQFGIQGTGAMPGAPGSRGFGGRSGYSPAAQGRYHQTPASTFQGNSFSGFGNGGGRYHQSGPGYQYHYHNGGFGRSVVTFYSRWGNYYYPYYYPLYLNGITLLSPYACYLGVSPLCIGMQGAFYEPPQSSDIPYPNYDDGVYNGYSPDNSNTDSAAQAPPAAPEYRVGEGAGQTSTPTQDAAQPTDSALDSALKDIESAWIGSGIQKLAEHIRNDGKIAVYLRGNYQYSLDSSDYLDMTRDALRNTKTVSFTLNSVTRKQDGLLTVSGKHVYTDDRGIARTVNISYALQKDGDTYYITQVGTAPEVLADLPAAAK